MCAGKTGDGGTDARRLERFAVLGDEALGDADFTAGPALELGVVDADGPAASPGWFGLELLT